MHFITGKHVSRRTFLRGMGAAVSLPYLDAMVPAGHGRAKAAVDGGMRLIAIENSHGAAGAHAWGATQHLWSPERVGRDFDLSPSALSPLEPYRDYLTIVSNTDVRMAEAFAPDEIGGDHPRSGAVFLTQAHPRKTQSSDVYIGTSLDQLYARRFGQDMPVPSMQLCIENVDVAGGCPYGYACAYTDAISWSSPSDPLPAIRDPRFAFDQLFGAGGTPVERALIQRQRRSILDWILDDLGRAQRELGPEDRVRLDRYLENIREVERRIERVEVRNRSGDPRELPDAPAGVPDSFDEHVKLMYDLQVLAFEADVTRVFSLKLSRDATGRPYPESGTTAPFHSASHHGDRTEAVLDLNLINRYHVSTLTYLLDRLKGSTEGDATLLDKTMILYGSSMGDPNLHNHKRCPLIVLGGSNGKLKGPMHLSAPDGTPMANAMLSLLHLLGMEELQNFGDSSGALTLWAPNSPAAIATSA